MPMLPTRSSQSTSTPGVGATSTASCRVTAEQKQQLDADAQAAGLTLADLVKKRVLGETPAPDRFELMAAELRAMRMIICSVLVAGIRGDDLGPEKVQAIVRQADGLKYAKGREAIVEFLMAKEGVDVDRQKETNT